MTRASAIRGISTRQVTAALQADRDIVERIAKSIYDGCAQAHFPAARENVRAHLEKLEAEGLAMDEDGTWRL